MSRRHTSSIRLLWDAAVNISVT